MDKTEPVTTTTPVTTKTDTDKTTLGTKTPVTEPEPTKTYGKLGTNKTPFNEIVKQNIPDELIEKQKLLMSQIANPKLKSIKKGGETTTPKQPVGILFRYDKDGKIYVGTLVPCKGIAVFPPNVTITPVILPSLAPPVVAPAPAPAPPVVAAPAPAPLVYTAPKTTIPKIVLSESIVKDQFSKLKPVLKSPIPLTKPISPLQAAIQKGKSSLKTREGNVDPTRGGKNKTMKHKR